MITALLPFNDEHLVGAFEKFIRHAAYRSVETCAAKRCERRSEVRRDLAVQIEQWKDADFRCDPAEFTQGRYVEGFCKVLRIEEEKVGAECKIEGAVRECEVRQSRHDITAALPAASEVTQEGFHCGHAQLAKCLD